MLLYAAAPLAAAACHITTLAIGAIVIAVAKVAKVV